MVSVDTVKQHLKTERSLSRKPWRAHSLSWCCACAAVDYMFFTSRWHTHPLSYPVPMLQWITCFLLPTDTPILSLILCYSGLPVFYFPLTHPSSLLSYATVDYLFFTSCWHTHPLSYPVPMLQSITCFLLPADTPILSLILCYSGLPVFYFPPTHPSSLLPCAAVDYLFSYFPSAHHSWWTMDLHFENVHPWLAFLLEDVARI